MSNRGRPKTPGVLTPREQEVLSLIRQGLSNRDIAERLEISLAGAKFHVSEIISKLGVSSREEAALWQAKEQRAFAIPWRGLLPKAVGAAVLTSAAVASFGFASWGWGHNFADRVHLSAVAPVAPTPTPEGFAGLQIPLIPQQMASLQDAANRASFQPQLPVYIPAGFIETSVEFLRLPTNPPGRRDVHNDSITVICHNALGNELVVAQGFPAMLGSGQYPTAPETKKGTVDLAGREGHWLRADPYSLAQTFVPSADNPAPVFVAKLNNGGLLLGWDAGRYGEGWAKNPTNPDIKYAGSPFDYAIASDSLSLDELTRIALSVPFITDPTLTP